MGDEWSGYAGAREKNTFQMDARDVIICRHFFGIWWWMGITSFKRLPDPISPKRLDVSRVTECSCNKSQLPISKIITNIYNLVCMSILSFMTVLDAYGLSNYYNFWWYSELVQIGNTKENIFVILPGNQCRLRFTLIM